MSRSDVTPDANDKRLRFAWAFTWVAATPQRIFWAFAATHLFLWTVVPLLTCPNAPLDVVEGYAWGHEWLLGTHKHPPMQAWWLGALALVSGRAAFVHFFASQLAIILSFWAVWQTGRRMFSEQAALLGTLLLEGVVYYNLTSPEFNPNVLQLPFWALTGLAFHKSVKEDHLKDWLLLGLWGACALYSKYSSGLLLLVLAVLFFVRPEGRRRLAGPGPYLAVLVTCLLFLPHILWLINNHFLPFTYAWDRMQNDTTASFITSSVKAPAFYGLSQIFALLPAIVLFLAFFDHGSLPRDQRFRSFDRDFLDFVTFGPFTLTLLLSVAVGLQIRDMWAMPFWNFIGLWAISRFKADFSRDALRRFTSSWLVVSFAFLIAYAGINVFTPYVTHRGLRVHFPGEAFADQMGATWHDRFGTPVTYVIGDAWAAGNIAYYLPEWPHTLLNGDFRISPWVSEKDIAERGGIAVWCVKNCSYKNREIEDGTPAFLDKFPNAEIQSPIVLAKQTDADVAPAKMGWAIVPPAPSSPLKP